jgi:hypothetical protein
MLGGVVAPGDQRGKARIRDLVVAAHAEGIPARQELEAVGIVAVAAPHSALVHPALQEGAVLVDLLEHLSVGVVEVRAKRHRHEVVEEGATRAILAAHQMPPGMTGCAGVDLVARVSGLEVHQQAVVSSGGCAQPLRLLGPSCALPGVADHRRRRSSRRWRIRRNRS